MAKEDALVERDLHPLAEIAQGDDIALQPAERRPVAAGVLQQLVGLGEPERALPAAQPEVEDDGGDLASLAAAGAVAEHPAPAEAHRLRQGLAVAGDEGGVDLLPGSGEPAPASEPGGQALVPIAVLAAAVDGLPAGADAVMRRQMAGMGLARQHDALQLGIGQQGLAHHPFRQHRAPGRRRMRHGGHGGGLHQRRRMFDCVRDPRRARPPGGVGAGIVAGRVGGRFERPGFDNELGNRSPVMDLPGLGRGYLFRTPLLCRLRRHRLAEQVARGTGRGRRHRDRQPLRDLRNGGVEQLGGVGCAGFPVDGNAGLRAPLQHRKAGVEAGAAPCIGAPVDGHGEDAARRRAARVAPVEAAEGVGPGGIAGHAVGRGDRDQPPARRQHGEGRADVAQIGVAADAVDPRRRREWRVHQHHGRPDVAQPVGDGFGVEGGDHSAGEQQPEEPGPRVRVFVEMQMADGAVAQRAFGHDGEHAGAGRGFQHDIARPDRGSLEGGVGERQRRRELLEPDLLLGALRVGRLQRGDGVQHRQHAARPVRPGAGVPAHGPAVVLEEEDESRFGGLVGVLPDPAALGVRRVEGPGHGIPEDRGIERRAGLESWQQGPGRGEQGIALDRTGRRMGRFGCGSRKLRTRGRVRRRLGVEHGRSPGWKGGRPAVRKC